LRDMRRRLDIGLASILCKMPSQISWFVYFLDFCFFCLFAEHRPSAVCGRAAPKRTVDCPASTLRARHRVGGGASVSLGSASLPCPLEHARRRSRLTRWHINCF
jgi:hypothetical protein